MDIHPGDVFKVSHNLWSNDQSYNIAVPCLLDDGSYGMVDTFQIRYPGGCNASQKYDAASEYIVKIASDHKSGSWAYRVHGDNFYHTNKCKLKNNESKFQFWFNVNDYEYVDEFQSHKYADEDTISEVKLYFEHGYSWHYGSIGINIKKKGAKMLPYLDFDVNAKDMLDMSNVPYGSTMRMSDNVKIGKSLLHSEIIHNSECLKSLKQGYIKMLCVEKLNELEKIYSKSRSSTRNFVENLSDEEFIEVFTKYIEGKDI